MFTRYAASAIIALTVFFPASQANTETILRVGVYGFPVGEGNPFRSTSISETFVYSAMYDGLTQVEDDGSILPMLATSWQADDSLTWRFTLRPDVTFADGTPFNADAVVKVAAYLTSPNAGADSVARELSALKSARAIDPLTVEIKTHVPTLILPALMAGIRIPSPSYVDALMGKTAGALPVGTGPFRVTEWSSDRIYLDAHADSWRAPKIQQMEFWKVPERTARLQALTSGTLHLAYGLGAEDIGLLENAGHTYFSGHGGGVFGLSFVNVKEGPIQNQKVRQALNYAVDKQAYIDVLLKGKTRPGSQATPSVAYGFDPELEAYPYDPERARALLAEAGYADGFDLVVEAVVEGSTSGSEVLQFVASQLAAVGVNMETRNIPISELIRKAVNGGFAGAAFSMDFDTMPTLDAMRPLPMHSCLRSVPWYCDPAVVPWIEEAQTTFDEEVRLGALRKILSRYHDNPPMLFLHETVFFDGVNATLHHYAPRARRANYHEVELAP